MGNEVNDDMKIEHMGLGGRNRTKSVEQMQNKKMKKYMLSKTKYLGSNPLAKYLN